MTEIRKQKLVIPITQENGQKEIFSKKRPWLRRQETLTKLLTPANEANTKFWRMVGRAWLHLHLNNHHGILIITSSFLPI